MTEYRVYWVNLVDGPHETGPLTFTGARKVYKALQAHREVTDVSFQARSEDLAGTWYAVPDAPTDSADDGE